MSHKILIVISLILIALAFQNCGGAPASEVEGASTLVIDPTPTPASTPVLPTATPIMPPTATPTATPVATPTPPLPPTIAEVIKKEVSDALAAQYKKLAEGHVMSRAWVIDSKEVGLYEKADQQLRDLYGKVRKAGTYSEVEVAAIRALIKSNDRSIDLYARQLNDYSRMLGDSRERIWIGRYFRQLTEKELLALDEMVVSFKKTLNVAAADRKLESAEREIIQKAIVALDAKISAYRTNDIGVPQPVDKLAASVQKKVHSLAYKTVKCYMGGTILPKRFKWFASVEREILDNVHDQQKTGLITKAIYDNAIKRIEVLDKEVTEDCAK